VIDKSNVNSGNYLVAAADMNEKAKMEMAACAVNHVPADPRNT